MKRMRFAATAQPGQPFSRPIGQFLTVILVLLFTVIAACGGDDDNRNQDQNPVPVLTSLSPNSAPVGGSAFTLTASGSGFVAGSTVHWNATARTTTFVSSTQLTAAIPSSDLSSAGNVQVTVVNPTPGGGASSMVSFTIENPAPIVTSLNPASALAGSGSFELNVTGSNFVTGSTIQWKGVARTTTFISSSVLRADIGAADVATSGTAQVTVVNPSPGGGTSSAITFTIQSPPVFSGTAEGLWFGRSSTDRRIAGLVLGSGEYWFIYSSVGNDDVIAGAVQGNGNSQDGRFTSSNGIDFNFEGAGNSPVTVDATYLAERSLDGIVMYNGSTNALTFSAAYQFEYGAPASLGPWITTTFTGTSYAGLTEYTEVTVATSGALTGVSASGCRFSGMATPGTDGNYYNVTVTFEGDPCVNGTGTVTGVAFFEFYERRLTSAALNPTRTSGFLFVGIGPPY